MYRALSLCVATAALALFATAVRAQDQSGSQSGHRGKSCTGTIVSVDPTGEKLVVKETGTGENTGSGNQGQNMEKSFTLTNNSRITCDGKSCQLSDLKPGMKVRVWTRSSDPTSVVRVEALEKNNDFGTGGGGGR